METKDDLTFISKLLEKAHHYGFPTCAKNAAVGLLSPGNETSLSYTFATKADTHGLLYFVIMWLIGTMLCWPSLTSQRGTHFGIHNIHDCIGIVFLMNYQDKVTDLDTRTEEI